MSKVKMLTERHMAKRIYDREDFAFNKKIITKQLIASILTMYMDECQRALADGERVQISNVGTIVPELRVRLARFNLPMCNKEGGNPPYTKLKINRNLNFGRTMNEVLLKNIDNGIYGLKNTPFSKQQLAILKESGFIPEDVETEENEEDEE